MRRRRVTLVLVLLWGAHASADGHGPPIVSRPIRFDEERRELTRQYIHRHYGLKVNTIAIVPRAIVVHWTGSPSLEGIWSGFDRVRLRTSRKHLQRGGALNVSAHFLVGRDGTIYQLMPTRWMARHCIGLNFDSIGIENVGDGSRHPLTAKQLSANAALIRHLVRNSEEPVRSAESSTPVGVRSHPITYLLGHMEWKRFDKAPFFRERDPTYRNAKADPGARFMRQLRAALEDLHLKDRYTDPPP